MRAADLHTGAAQIRDAMKDLQIAWQETAEQWNDGVSRRFCEQYLEPLGPSVKLSLDALQRLMAVADQMQRECEQ